MALTHINVIKGLLMKHTIEELRFAASVRELASGLRNAARPRNGDWNDAAFKETVERWDLENPESAFVSVAMDRINTTADIIKDIINRSS